MHSVDSERLLDALDAFGRTRGSPVPVLLEVNCSREATKGGFAPEDVPPPIDTLRRYRGGRARADDDGAHPIAPTGAAR